MATRKTLKPRFEPLLLKTALFKQPVHIFCKQCGKSIPSTWEWVCGYCGHEHRNIRVYSFLYKCQQCKRQPRAFVCPHCKALNRFDKDDSGKYPARKIPVVPPPAKQPPPPPPPPPAESDLERRRREHREELEDLGRKIERAKKLAELKTEEERINVNSKEDLVEEQFLIEFRAGCRVDDVVAKYTTILTVLHKDDADRLEQRLARLRETAAKYD